MPMIMRCPLPLFVLVGLAIHAAPSRAQLNDTFADGDFSSAPAWTGETDQWSIVPFGDDFALRTDGPAATDTLYLATPSTLRFGRWSTTVSYEDGLSNFNKVRIYLMADRADLEGRIRGYYLELGTNDRNATLFRSDPDRAGERVELAASGEAILPAAGDTLHVTVDRTSSGSWSIALDGTSVIDYQESDSISFTSGFFGLWVKHSSSRSHGYYFDDVVVSRSAEVEDTTPPFIDSVAYADQLPGFRVFFNEDIDFATVDRSDFSVGNGVGQPVNVQPLAGRDSSRALALELAAALSSGLYDFTARDLSDRAGNILADTTVLVRVEADETPPSIAHAEAISADTVRVTFDERVQPEAACEASTYTLGPEIGPPVAVLCPVTEPGNPSVASVDLVLPQPLTPGRTYVLTASGLADMRGNVQTTATASVALHPTGAVPSPGDVVINEFNYRAFGSDFEYVELLNLSEKVFDLREFALSDANRTPSSVTRSEHYLFPEEYVVLARDTTALSKRFAGVASIELPDWPALNNGGDEIVLSHQNSLTVDSLSYTSTWGIAEAAVERISPRGPSTLSTNWSASISAAGGTPGVRNSVYTADTTAPALRSVTPNEIGDTLRVTFSEPIDPATLHIDDFSIVGGAMPVIEQASADGPGVLLSLAGPIEVGSYTLQVTQVADYAGNMLHSDAVDFTVFRGASPRPRDIVINEIHFDPPAPGEQEEYVELLNTSDETFNLADLTFSDEEADPRPLTNRPTPLRPGEYAVLVRNAEAFAAALSEVPSIELGNWPTLNNAGDTPTLRFGDEVIDAVAYEQDWSAPGLALERIDPAGPSNHPAGWAASTAPLGGTPGTRNSVFAPDDAPPRLLFVEQLADTVLAARFDEPLDPATVTPRAFDAEGQVPVAIESLDEGFGARLVFGSRVVGTQLAVRGIADLTGNRTITATLPIAWVPQNDEVAINEVLYAPASDSSRGRPPAPEYVELVNLSERLLSLHGVLLTSTTGDDTLAAAQEPAALAPGSFAVIFADPKAPADPTRTSSLAAAFPGVPFDELGTTLLPVARASLSLSNEGETVVLHRTDGTVLDAVPYDPDWHSPDLEDTRGVALERIHPATDAEAATNWSSAVVEAGGTPGQTNSIFTDPGTAPADAGLSVTPSPFSPDGDGYDDFTTITYVLDAAPATVRARVYNQTGRLVRTLTPATLGSATGHLTWDGRDDDGRRLRMGIYVIVLDAVAAEAGRTEAYRIPVVVARKL